jgi:UDP-N-acetylmuramate--alanine ligase
MVTKIKNNFLSSEFTVKEKKKKYAVTLNIPGFHNVENALAAIATAREMGVNIKDIQNSIPSFLGIKRRFELLGEFKIDQNSFYWIDDYGHHPTEILAVYNSVKEIWPKRKILVVFQPHRYSRTKDLSKEFKKIFRKIDKLVILDIYAASEKNKDKIDINKIFKENLSKKNALHIKGFKNLEKYLLKSIQNEYVLITMGAGDISKFVLSFKDHKKVIKI